MTTRTTTVSTFEVADCRYLDHSFSLTRGRVKKGEGEKALFVVPVKLTAPAAEASSAIWLSLSIISSQFGHCDRDISPNIAYDCLLYLIVQPRQRNSEPVHRSRIIARSRLRVDRRSG